MQASNREVAVTDRRPNCFISFNVADGDRIARVIELLQTLGVDTYRVDTLAGQRISQEIHTNIQAADFLCLIMNDALPSPSVAFEAGLAIGLGKPVLALAEGADIPFDFARGVQVLKMPDGDVASVQRDVARFVRHLRLRPQAARRDAVTGKLIEWAEDALDRLERAPAPWEREARLVDLVARLFEQQGSEVLREKREGNYPQLDLLVWNDSLVADLGGPLIVECKYYGGGSGSVLINARQTLEQLESYVAHSSAKLGLLVFDHDRSADLSLTDCETTRTLAISIRDFVAAMESGDLPEKIWRRRARPARSRADRGNAG